jgi:hypothetical protein
LIGPPPSSSSHVEQSGKGDGRSVSLEDEAVEAAELAPVNDGGRSIWMMDTIELVDEPVDVCGGCPILPDDEPERP